METTELNDFAHRQQHKKGLTLAVLAGVGCVAAVLFFLLSPGNKFDVYTFGDQCASDCGQHAGNALLCLGNADGQGYCSRPCGNSYPNCPSNFECGAWSEDKASQKHNLYCLKVGKPLTLLKVPPLDLGQPVVASSHMTFEPEMVNLSREHNVFVGPAEVTNSKQ